MAQEGINYCLAKRDESKVGEESGFFADRAKSLAYNLASFLWPGWDEPGIELDSSDLAAGLDAARLNLRLAIEQNKAANRIEDAHWLLGAQLIAAGDLTAAMVELRQTSPQTRPLFRGYMLLAQALLGEPATRDEFHALVATMRKQGEKDGTREAVQLETAYRVFTRTRAKPDKTD